MKKIFLFIIIFIGIKVSGQDLTNIGKEKLATFHGFLGATTYVYGIDGAPARRVPFSYILEGGATLTIKGFSLPFYFQYSEEQRSFRQPFNQFGISPTYKWIKLHLGWRSVNFSNYTLNNHVFLGAGIELTPGILRFGAVYGRFQKAVKEDTSQQVYNAPAQYPIAAYNQYAYAIKLGIGSARNFFDLVYLHGKDDSSSVSANPQVQLTAPAENVTIGAKAHLTFYKKVTFDADGGLSIYTRDQRADTLSTGTSPAFDIVKTVILPRFSTNVYYAGDASLQYKEKLFGAALKYNLIMPDYKSMGIYYLQTDLERITFSPYVNNAKGTLQTSGSIGLEHDNIDQKKEAQTQRIIGALNINISPKPTWGITFSYSNFGISQKPGLKSLSDTIVLDQVSQSIIVTPRLTFQRPNAVHTFVYLFSDQTLNDRNKFYSTNFSMTSLNNTLTYVLSLNKSGLNVDMSAYYITTDVSAGSSTSIGGSAGLNKGFFKKNLLNASINGTYSTNTFQGVSDGYTLQLRSTNTINIDRKNRFRLDFIYTKNKSISEAINRSFNEFLLTVSYGYTF